MLYRCQVYTSLLAVFMGTCNGWPGHDSLQLLVDCLLRMRAATGPRIVGPAPRMYTLYPPSANVDLLGLIMCLRTYLACLIARRCGLTVL